MEIFPINHYHSQRNSNGKRVNNSSKKILKNTKIDDAYEPSIQNVLPKSKASDEYDFIFRQIEVLPELRANLLIQTKDDILQGKYNEPEIIEPMAESLM